MICKIIQIDKAENAIKIALHDSGKFIPWNVVNIVTVTVGSMIERA